MAQHGYEYSARVVDMDFTMIYSGTEVTRQYIIAESLIPEPEIGGLSIALTDVENTHVWIKPPMINEMHGKLYLCHVKIWHLV